MTRLNLDVFFQSFFANVGSKLPSITFKIIWILAIIFLSKPLIRLVNRAGSSVMKKHKVDPLLKTFLLSLLNMVSYIFVFFLLIGGIGIQATSLITILGTAGIAIGLALQGSLTNLAGGILILLFKPFNKGDYIESDSGSGLIDGIRILYTTIVTFDNRVIIIPNGALANSPVTNLSRNPERRLDLTICVSYDSDIDLVKKTLKDIADNHPQILHEKPYIIRLLSHNSSSLDFVFKVWTPTLNYWNVKFDLMEEVVLKFRENDIEIPYNKLDIYNKTLDINK
ncbi:mechanosensitive ion channel family protein [Fusobacterium sp. IOR10]|uniref:mechanosensitive ion channel family protein n=1 Tax=Fusobacterium sp. IOR10 TaxID=2665157 RepID=UPI0013D818EE|nr:mechanosensitive ion channel domain-containing protein [Fusobacterium sp. IOR10]